VSHRSIAFALTVISVSASLPEPVRAQAASFLRDTLASKGGVALPYRLFVPKNYDPSKKYPLVFALHGYGERGSDNDKQLTIHHLATLWARDSVQARHPSFVLAPQCPANGDDRWIYVDFGKGSYDQSKVPISKYLVAALEILDTTLVRYAIDTNRLYVAGLSMGGYATWDVISRYPKRFAAAVPICGGADTSKATLIRHMPIWTFHGDADGTVPVKSTREIVAALRKAGGSPKYTEYPGVDHGSWGPALQEPGLPAWLFAQVRSPAVSITPVPGGLRQRRGDAPGRA
jgi:predicted peptidase